MNNIKISIIVPIYNVADYVKDCIESIIVQTYPDIELIVIDDRGNDNSMQIVNALLERASSGLSIKIITHNQNKGLSAARNTGIRNSSGDYLYFLDSDDMIVSDCIERMVNCLKRHPSCDIVQAGSTVNSTKFQWLNHESWALNGDYSDNVEWIAQTMLKRLNCIPVTAWNKLIKKDFITDNNLFFYEGLIHEDELWSFQVARCIKSVAFCRYNTYIYNIREGSITTKESKEELLKSWVKIFEEMIESISDGENSIFSQWINKHIYTLLYAPEIEWIKHEQERLNQKLNRKMNR